MDLEDLLERWHDAGLLTRSQAEAIRSFEARTRGLRPGGDPAPPQSPRPAPGGPVPEDQAPPPAAVPPEPSTAAPPDPVPPPMAPVPPAAPGRRSGAQRPAQPAAGDLPSFGLGLDIPTVDLRNLGVVLAGLGLIALLGSIFALGGDLFISRGQNPALELEDMVHVVASGLGLAGGLRLLSGRERGRVLVYWSLGLNAGATILFGARHLAQPMTLLALAAWAVLAVVTWRARYRTRYRYF